MVKHSVLLSVSTAAIMIASGNSAAIAQTTPGSQQAAEPGAPDGDQAQDIVVTGTSIRGVAPVGSAVVSISRDDIEASPAVTTSQLLLETPQVFNSGISEGSRSGPGGSTNVVSATAISLRGLGPFATLTLFDGRRPVPNGTTGGFVDPSSIPTIALQRVEVIADGASAIYGSDAVAGVVNLVLRRSYDGVGVDFRYGVGDEYRDTQISAIAGKDWGSGRFTLAYQHSYRSNVFGGDRDFVSSDLRPGGGVDFRTTSCSPGNIVIGGISYAIPEGGATPANLVRNTQNRCDQAQLTDLLPRQEFNSVSLTMDQDLAPGWRVWLTAYGTRRDALRRTPQLTQNLTVPRTNAFFVAPAGLNPASATVQYSFARELGPIDKTPAFSKAAQIFLGTEVKVTGDIRFQLSGSYGRNRDETARNAFDTAALTAALASSDSATALNPFGTSLTQASVIDRIRAYTDDIFGETTQYSFEAKLDGTVVELPGGPLRFAAGADYLNVAVLTGTRRGPNTNVVYFARDLRRNVKAAYGEVYVPLFGPGNAVPGIQKLEIDIAGRIEEYSDAGATKNPKIGVNWTPVNGVVVRGSYGTSFRAPSLTQVYTPAGGGLYIRNYIDPLANGGAGGTIPGVGLFADNPNLRPETARTWSMGVDLEPAFLPNARLSLNYFNVKYEGQIIGFNNNTSILLKESFYSELIVRQPTAAFLQPFLDRGHVIQGGTATNYFNSQVFIYASNTNLGITQTDGLDYQLDASFSLADAGQLSLRSSGTYYFNFQAAVSAAAPLIERVNTIDNPLRFRNRTSLTWSSGGFAAMAAFNFSNAYRNTSATPEQRVDAYTTVDLNLGYTFSDGGVLEGLRIGLEASNLFDRDPPYVRFNSGFDPAVANPTGRVVALTLGKKF